MATSFLLKSNIYLNPLTNHYSIIQFSPIQSFTRSPNLPRLFTNPRLTLKCYVASQNLNKPVLNLVKREIKRNPYELFVDAILKALKPIQEATVALVFFMAMAFMSFSPNSAFAAGGGRMGGRSFPSKNTSTPTRSSPTRSSPTRSSPSTSSPSRSSPSRSSPSRSSPSRSSSSTSSPSRSSPTRSSPTRSYPSTSSPSRSYPSTSSPSRSSSSTSSPSRRNSSSSSFWSSPSPSVSSSHVNVIVVESSPSESPQSKSPPPESSPSTPSVLSSYAIKSGGGDSETLVESVSVSSGPPSIIQQQKGIWVPKNVCIASVIFLCSALAYFALRSTPPTRTSVIKLQVGLLGLARSLQTDLDRIAETADTSTKEGLTYILTETTLAILRHPDYCISAHSSVDLKSDMADVENLFNRLSIEERGNLDEETLVNVDNIKKPNTSNKGSTGFNNEYIVITILVAAEGEYKLSTISSIEDLKEALKMLGSILTKKTLAVEVLWTPQDENETLTEQEMLENYPLLRLY